MAILRLSKRALSIIILAALGLTIAFSLPVVSQQIMTTSSNHAPLSQPINWQQASEHLQSYSSTKNITKQSPLTNLTGLRSLKNLETIAVAQGNGQIEPSATGITLTLVRRRSSLFIE